MILHETFIDIADLLRFVNKKDNNIRIISVFPDVDKHHNKIYSLIYVYKGSPVYY